LKCCHHRLSSLLLLLLSFLPEEVVFSELSLFLFILSFRLLVLSHFPLFSLFLFVLREINYKNSTKTTTTTSTTPPPPFIPRLVNQFFIGENWKEKRKSKSISFLFCFCFCFCFSLKRKKERKKEKVVTNSDVFKTSKNSKNKTDDNVLNRSLLTLIQEAQNIKRQQQQQQQQATTTTTNTTQRDAPWKEFFETIEAMECSGASFNHLDVGLRALLGDAQRESHLVLLCPTHHRPLRSAPVI